MLTKLLLRGGIHLLGLRKFLKSCLLLSSQLRGALSSHGSLVCFPLCLLDYGVPAELPTAFLTWLLLSLAVTGLFRSAGLLSVRLLLVACLLTVRRLLRVSLLLLLLRISRLLLLLGIGCLLLRVRLHLLSVCLRLRINLRLLGVLLILRRGSGHLLGAQPSLLRALGALSRSRLGRRLIGLRDLSGIRLRVGLGILLRSRWIIRLLGGSLRICLLGGSLRVSLLGSLRIGLRIPLSAAAGVVILRAGVHSRLGGGARRGGGALRRCRVIAHYGRGTGIIARYGLISPFALHVVEVIGPIRVKNGSLVGAGVSVRAPIRGGPIFS